MPKRFGGASNSKAPVARQWLQCFENSLHQRVFFSTLAVDRQSLRYECKRFRRDFQAYDRFTATALKTAIAWHLARRYLHELTIHFVSDAKDRPTRPDRAWTDNCESYLPYRAELDGFVSQKGGRPCPSVSLDLALRDFASEDLRQFCDVMLGATQMALVAGSSHLCERGLGEIVVGWCCDLQQQPWKQQFGLHRKFNLWAFPDQRGRPYNRLELALKIDDRQMGLF